MWGWRESFCFFTAVALFKTTKVTTINSLRDKSRDAAEDGSMNGSCTELYIYVRVITDLLLSIFFYKVNLVGKT